MLRLFTLGAVLNLTVQRAQSFLPERARGYNIVTSGWSAPYFSPGSAGCLYLRSAVPFWSVGIWFEPARAPERDLGDCAHVRDVVLAQASNELCCAGLVYIRMTVIYIKMPYAVVGHHI